MSNRLNRLAPCLLVGFCAAAVMLKCEIQSASAHEVHKRTVEAHALDEAKPTHTARTPGSGSAKGSYYVDFRARTAASWGHAFVWYGRTGERQVEVAGLTPAGDSLDYVLGYVMRVPSETGASYGDLDPQYLTASYRVYLNEPDAKRVFAYIKKLQASSPVWNAETSNCNAFIGSIANFMGLKVPNRWERPENYVNNLKAMNGGRQMIHLSERSLASWQ